MFRHAFTFSAVALAATLAGCSANQGATATTEDLGPTQLAAFSAKAQYPQTQPADTLRAAAIVNKANGTIIVFNFSSHPLGASKVWVNRSFVYHVFGIAPQSKVVIRTDQLYDGLGNTFAAQKADVSTVQLETPDGFFSVEGPAVE